MNDKPILKLDANNQNATWSNRFVYNEIKMTDDVIKQKLNDLNENDDILKYKYLDILYRKNKKEYRELLLDLWWKIIDNTNSKIMDQYIAYIFLNTYSLETYNAKTDKLIKKIKYMTHHIWYTIYLWELIAKDKHVDPNIKMDIINRLIDELTHVRYIQNIIDIASKLLKWEDKIKLIKQSLQKSFQIIKNKKALWPIEDIKFFNLMLAQYISTKEYTPLIKELRYKLEEFQRENEKNVEWVVWINSTFNIEILPLQWTNVKNDIDKIIHTIFPIYKSTIIETEKTGILSCIPEYSIDEYWEFYGDQNIDKNNIFAINSMVHIKTFVNIYKSDELISIRKSLQTSELEESIFSILVENFYKGDFISFMMIAPAYIEFLLRKRVHTCGWVIKKSENKDKDKDTDKDNPIVSVSLLQNLINCLSNEVDTSFSDIYDMLHFILINRSGYNLRNNIVHWNWGSHTFNESNASLLFFTIISIHFYIENNE